MPAIFVFPVFSPRHTAVFDAEMWLNIEFSRLMIALSLSVLPWRYVSISFQSGDMGVSENGGIPKSSHVNRVFHYKPSILGYPYFRKHPDMFTLVFVWNIPLKVPLIWVIIFYHQGLWWVLRLAKWNLFNVAASGRKSSIIFHPDLLLEKKNSTKIIAPLTKQLKIPFFEMFSWCLLHATFLFRPKWGPCC